MKKYSTSHLDFAEKGYITIPTTRDAVPLVKGFMKRTEPYSLSTIEGWQRQFPDANVALKCGNVVALDIDVDDASVMRRLLYFIRQNISPYVIKRYIRSKLHHRIALFFKPDGELPNATSNTYDTVAGLNQIELISTKTITLLGIHRKNGREYRCDLYSQLIDDLPSLSFDQLKTIFNHYHSLMDFTSTPIVTKSRVSRPVNSKGIETARATKKVDDAKIDEMLSKVDGSTRDNWLKVGMALHAHYAGSVKGFRKWNEWASKFDGYKGTQDCEYHWSTFHADGGVTMGTVKHLADEDNDEVKQDDPLAFALKNYVFIGKTNEVGDLSKSVNESIINYYNMRNYKMNIKVRTETKGKTKMLVKYVPLLNAWLSHPDRLCAYSTEYIPINKRLVDGREIGQKAELYYNCYVPPVVEKPKDEVNLLKYFLEHIDYMFSSNPEWVVNWFAQIVQQPLKRHRTVLYSISTHTGTGRGWLAKLASKIYGVDNVKTISSMAKIADASAKNGYLDKSLMLIVNETEAQGSSKYEVGDRLKTIVSDDMQEVDIKYGGQSFNQRIYTRVFLQSNSINNLVIDRNDNRIQPFINMKKPKDEDYYTRLYNLIDDPEFINQVWWYLKNYQIREKDLQTAYPSEEKDVIIESNLSSTASAFYSFLSIIGDGIFNKMQLNMFIRLHMQTLQGETLNTKELRHLFGEQIYFRKKVGDTTVYAVSIDDKLLSTESEIAESLATSEKLIKQHWSKKKC